MIFFLGAISRKFPSNSGTSNLKLQSHTLHFRRVPKLLLMLLMLLIVAVAVVWLRSCVVHLRHEFESFDAKNDQ